MEEQKEVLEEKKAEYSPNNIWLDYDASRIMNDFKRTLEQKYLITFSWSDVIRKLKLKKL